MVQWALYTYIFIVYQKYINLYLRPQRIKLEIITGENNKWTSSIISSILVETSCLFPIGSAQEKQKNKYARLYPFLNSSNCYLGCLSNFVLNRNKAKHTSQQGRKKKAEI